MPKKINLKGRTTIYQHAQGIGMTNDKKKNINPLFYNSQIMKLKPIIKEKQKENGQKVLDLNTENDEEDEEESDESEEEKKTDKKEENKKITNSNNIDKKTVSINKDKKSKKSDEKKAVEENGIQNDKKKTSDRKSIRWIILNI